MMIIAYMSYKPLIKVF